MNPIWLDALLVAVVILNFRVLGGSRLIGAISTLAMQGFLLSLVPLLAHAHVSFHLWITVIAGLGVKGLLLPYLLKRAIRESAAKREMQPIVGLNASLLYGLGALALSGWLGAHLPLPPGSSALGAPVSFFTLLAGLFLVIARRQALTQVVGYLMLENGIFLFGVLFIAETPWMIEIGVLLDVLVGVFVMGLILFHIQRTFDALDSDRLAQLHDKAMREVRR